MIKLKTLITESDDMLNNTKKETYVIQKNWIGYDAWQDNGKEFLDKNKAVEAYIANKQVVAATPQTKEIIRLIKRTTMVNEEIIDI